MLGKYDCDSVCVCEREVKREKGEVEEEGGYSVLWGQDALNAT